jgi:hypothetical protein
VLCSGVAVACEPSDQNGVDRIPITRSKVAAKCFGGRREFVRHLCADEYHATSSFANKWRPKEESPNTLIIFQHACALLSLVPMWDFITTHKFNIEIT